MRFEYIISGKKYSQSMLVLDQIQQLAELLKGSGVSRSEPDIPSKTFNYLMSKDLLATAAAILLLPEEASLKDKDIKALTETFKFELDLKTAMKICADFFAVNNFGDVLDGLKETLNVLNEKIQSTTKNAKRTTKTILKHRLNIN